MSSLGQLFQNFWIFQVDFICFLRILTLSISILNLARSDVVVSSECQLNTIKDRM